jgi:hypothetical protein
MTTATAAPQQTVAATAAPASTSISTKRLLTEQELIAWCELHQEQIRRVGDQLFLLETMMNSRALFSLESDRASILDDYDKARQSAVASLPVVPDAALRLAIVAKVILSDKERFDMSRWHSPCGTVHCIGGWAAELAGDTARCLLEGARGAAFVAGACLLGPDAASHFFDSQQDALAYLSQFED